MKFSSIFAATVAVFAPAIQAQYANVINDCAFTVYIQSVPYGGGAPGPLTTVPSGGTFAERYRLTGSTVKMGRGANLAAPLFFGYSFSNNVNNVFYELKDQFGNPFANFENDLATSRSGCRSFSCAPGSGASCYSRPGSQKIYTCPRPTNVTATLCVPQ